VTKTFCVGRLACQVSVASLEEPYWWVMSDKGHRHAFLFAVSTVTSDDGIRIFNIDLGPLQLSFGLLGA
jgi:hypothetical protein